MSADGDSEALQELLDYLKLSRGFDFNGYKKTTLSRRIEKRVASVGASSFAEYQDYLEVNPREFTELFNTILINVTSFFRDAPAWEHLAEEIVPSLLNQLGPDGQVRVWSAGCAAGDRSSPEAQPADQTGTWPSRPGWVKRLGPISSARGDLAPRDWAPA